jgi:hypothetical protein
MKTETYNGWTNYATWRVNLEIFDGTSLDMSECDVTAEWAKEYAHDVISFGVSPSITLSYAEAFISECNWQEIADAVNEK